MKIREEKAEEKERKLQHEAKRLRKLKEDPESNSNKNSKAVPSQLKDPPSASASASPDSLPSHRRPKCFRLPGDTYVGQPCGHHSGINQPETVNFHDPQPRDAEMRASMMFSTLRDAQEATARARRNAADVADRARRDHPGVPLVEQSSNSTEEEKDDRSG